MVHCCFTHIAWDHYETQPTMNATASNLLTEPPDPPVPGWMAGWPLSIRVFLRKVFPTLLAPGMSLSPRISLLELSLSSIVKLRKWIVKDWVHGIPNRPPVPNWVIYHMASWESAPEVGISMGKSSINGGCPMSDDAFGWSAWGAPLQLSGCGAHCDPSPFNCIRSAVGAPDGWNSYHWGVVKPWLSSGKRTLLRKITNFHR